MVVVYAQALQDLLNEGEVAVLWAANQRDVMSLMVSL